MSAADPIAVVGLAALFPAAPDATTFWENIAAGRDAISDVPAQRWDPEYFDPAHAGAERFYCNRGGFVDDIATFDPARFGIMPVAVDHADPDQLLALSVAAAAVEDAGGTDELVEDPRRVGVILGRGGYYNAGVVRLDQRVRVAEQVCTTLREVMPGIRPEEIERVRDAFRQQLGPEHPEAMIGLVPNLTASRIANRLDLQGPAYTVDAACASSLVAVDQAVHELRSGRCDVMLAGGSHHCHDVTFWSVFTQLGALSPTGVIRPFDRKADGLLIGEGTGVVVLQRLADAERAGRRVYAVIRGTGVSSDGRDTSLMRPKMSGQLLALERAWSDAGLDPATVGLLEAHGTATPAGDRTELDTIAAFFGPAGDDDPASPARPGLGSVKSMIGHTMPAAGAAGLIKAVLALHHRVLPPTINCEEPSRALAASRFRILGEAEPWEAGPSPRRAGVNAFGFGGTNAHVVLQEAPDATTTRVAAVIRRSSLRAAAGLGGGKGRGASTGDRVLMLAGSSSQEILAQLGSASDDGDLLARDDLASPPEGSVRLAMVGATAKRLAVARRVVAQGRPWRGRSDLWFTTDGLLDPAGSHAGRLAFIYPGVEPEFAPQVDDVAALLDVPAPDIESGGIIGFQAAAIVTVGRLLHRALGVCGITPDVAAGHSIGEMTATLMAGMAPEDVYDELVAQLDIARVELPDTLFAALGCGVEEAAPAVAEVPGVVISHDNCPHQAIICGEEGAVRTVLARLRTRRIMAVELPFRSGFHSPMFEPYLGTIAGFVEALPYRKPAIETWSATICAPYPDDAAEVRILGVRHLLEPVRFRELVENLWASGVRGFVQVGTGSLTGFVEDTLHGRDILCVDAASAKHRGVDQLRRVVAALWAEGRPGLESQVLAAGAEVHAGTAAPGFRPGAAGRSGTGRMLRLGAPIIRLGDSVRIETPRPQADRRAGQQDTPGAAPAWAPMSTGDAGAAGLAGRVGEELQAFLAEVADAGAVVARAYQQATASSRSGGATGAQASGAAPAAPAVPTRRAVPPGGAVAPRRGSPPGPAAPARGPGQDRSSTPGPGSASGAGHGSVGNGNGNGNGNGHGTGIGNGHGVAGSGGAGPGSASAGPGVGTAARVGGAPAARAERSERIMRVSLQTMPWLVDHAFFHVPPGWPDWHDRFPVVPMATTVQIVVDEAAALASDAIPVGLRSLRALRWTTAVPPTDVPVRATRVSDTEVRVVLEGYAKAVVVLGSAHAPAPMVDLTQMAGEHPTRHTAAQLYEQRWMFHGPKYQSVVGLRGISTAGIRGRVRCSDAPGSLLDGAAQLVGYWVHMSVDYNQMALPSTIDEVTFHGPHPAPGEELDCIVRITELHEDRVVADVDIAYDDGRVWCRMLGWVERRFMTDPRTFETFKYPERNAVTDVQPGGWVLARETWNDAATRDLLVRVYTTAVERAGYDRLNPRQQRHWVLGRVAAKDAARLRLAEAGATGVYPVEIQVDNDDRGAPRFVVDHPAGRGMHLSIAHTDWLGVALVGNGPVGIDIEKVAERSARFEEMVSTPAERALVAAAAEAGRDEALTRLWCAKEAAAKATGMGLQGNPRAFAVEEVDGDRYLIGGRWVATTTLALQEGAFVVAWTADR